MTGGHFFQTRFPIGHFVMIDEDESIKARIVAITARMTSGGEVISYELAWMHNGNPVNAWVEEWRLETWEP